MTPADTNPLREALKWYATEAQAANKAMAETHNPDAMVAILTVLANDAGKRAFAALASEPVAGTVIGCLATVLAHAIEGRSLVKDEDGELTVDFEFASLERDLVVKALRALSAPAPAGREAIQRILRAHFYTGEPGDIDAIKAATEALSSLSPQALATTASTPDRSAEFVMWALMEGSWQGADIDGGAAQDKAVALGLIVETQYDPKKHGQNGDCVPGDSWFVPSDTLVAALEKPTPPAPGAADRAAVIEEAAHIASVHAHHALWQGLLEYGWDTKTETFGRGLANRIAAEIRALAVTRANRGTE